MSGIRRTSCLAYLSLAIVAASSIIAIETIFAQPPTVLSNAECYENCTSANYCDQDEGDDCTEDNQPNCAAFYLKGEGYDICIPSYVTCRLAEPNQSVICKTRYWCVCLSIAGGGLSFDCGEALFGGHVNNIVDGLECSPWTSPPWDP